MLLSGNADLSLDGGDCCGMVTNGCAPVAT